VRSNRFPLSQVFGSVACVALAACLEVPTPRQTGLARDITTPDGSSPEQACTPSGVETCFDAIDNNCNGVIDEGCGVHTGILQFSIAWAEPNADVDLDVMDPSGDVAQAGAARTSGGLIKDRDCPKPTGECLGQNIENVYLDEDQPQKGRYRVAVRLTKLGDATAPIHIHLGARLGQRSYGFAFDLSPGEKTSEKVFEFTI
jgi:Putative metal-binding motif